MNKQFRWMTIVAIVFGCAAFSACSSSDDDDGGSGSLNGNTKTTPSDSVNGNTKATAVDLGLSVKWASHNVGATSPEGYGDHYAWGETTTKSDYSRDTYKYYYSSTDSYKNIGKSISGTSYDVAHVKWGGSWRLPTQTETKELVDNCASSITTLNGVKGMKFVSKKNRNSIFLPFAGSRMGTSVDGQGDWGAYWSGTHLEGSSFFAYNLDVDNDGFANWSSDARYFGFSVRPVTP